jgi:hypothetical protein
MKRQMLSWSTRTNAIPSAPTSLLICVLMRGSAEITVLNLSQVAPVFLPTTERVSCPFFERAVEFRKRHLRTIHSAFPLPARPDRTRNDANIQSKRNGWIQPAAIQLPGRHSMNTARHLSDKIFERLFVPSIIQPNAGEAFQIPGDWLTWGDYLDLQIGVNTGGPGNKWSAWFQLISLDGDLASRDLTFDEVKARLSKDGSSNFTLDATMAEPRMSIDGLPVPFILHRGSNDMMAAIEVCDYEAKNLNDAVMLGRTYFNYLNAMFILNFTCR